VKLRNQLVVSIIGTKSSAVGRGGDKISTGRSQGCLKGCGGAVRDKLTQSSRAG
jgi:hypothetical protein